MLTLTNLDISYGKIQAVRRVTEKQFVSNTGDDLDVIGVAFDAGMAEQLREIDAIANNPEAPTFQNTIVAMEKSGQLLDRASNVFFNLVGTDKNDARDKLQSDYAPKFSAHRDAITLNPKLFARIKALHDARDTLGLDAVDRRLLEKRYQDFVRAGAALTESSE